MIWTLKDTHSGSTSKSSTTPTNPPRYSSIYLISPKLTVCTKLGWNRLSFPKGNSKIKSILVRPSTSQLSGQRNSDGSALVRTLSISRTTFPGTRPPMTSLWSTWTTTNFCASTMGVARALTTTTLCHLSTASNTRMMRCGLRTPSHTPTPIWTTSCANWPIAKSWAQFWDRKCFAPLSTACLSRCSQWRKTFNRTFRTKNGLNYNSNFQVCSKSHSSKSTNKPRNS